MWPKRQWPVTQEIAKENRHHLTIQTEANYACAMRSAETMCSGPIRHKISEGDLHTIVTENMCNIGLLTYAGAVRS